jgi:hypothetical protein
VSKTIAVKRFRARPGRKIDLADWSTRVPSFYKSKEDYRTLLDAHTRRLSERQTLLYAHDRYALLLIFQAMDAAGKDGVIKHVMSGVNPQGCQVYSFTHPSAEDPRSRFPVANDSQPARARPHRHLQPLVLRRGAHRPRARRDLARPAPAEEAFDDGGIWKGRFRSIVSSKITCSATAPAC